jgi:[acyl-carrier-protein] S-malonyltransferase
MNHVAYVFPGQGSQSKGMLKELADQYPIVEETFAEASDVLAYDLWDLVQNDEKGTLNQTHITQPALLAASVAVFRVLQGIHTTPKLMAGHSLGEYSALVCAGIMDFKEAIALVQARGIYMQNAVPEGDGAMYAIIGLDDERIEDICQQVQQDSQSVVAPVNYNSPGQVVIAGSKSSVEQAASLCKEAGAKRALPLAVSAPSHCALMKPAAEKLSQTLNTVHLKHSDVKIINNVDVAIFSSENEIKDALVRQLFCPVKWTQTVEVLAAHGVTHIVEVGPGKVLSGLIKRIDKTINVQTANSPDTVNITIE